MVSYPQSKLIAMDNQPDADGMPLGQVGKAVAIYALRRLLRVRNVRCFPKWNYRAVPEGVCNQGLIADQCLRPFLYPSCGTRL